MTDDASGYDGDWSSDAFSMVLWLTEVVEIVCKLRNRALEGVRLRFLQ